MLKSDFSFGNFTFYSYLCNVKQNKGLTIKNN